MAENENMIFHELGELKGEVSSIKRSNERIEKKLDGLKVVSQVAFDEFKEETEMRIDDHEKRIDELERRAIKNDSSFVRKLGEGFEKRLVSWIIGLVLIGLVAVVILSQQQEIRNLMNEVNIIRSR